MRRRLPLIVAAVLLAVGGLMAGGVIGYPERAPAFQVRGDDPGELWEAEPFGPLADDPEVLAEIRARLSGIRKNQGTPTRWSATPEDVHVLYAPDRAVALVDDRSGALSWPWVRDLQGEYIVGGSAEHVVAVVLERPPAQVAGAARDQPSEDTLGGAGALLFAPAAARVTAQGAIDVLADGWAARAPTEPVQLRTGVWWVPRAGRLDVAVTTEGWTWRRSWDEGGGSFDPTTDMLTTQRGSPRCAGRSGDLRLMASWQAGLANPAQRPDLLWCGQTGNQGVAVLGLTAPSGGTALLGVGLSSLGTTRIELATPRAAGDPLASGLAWRRPDGGLALVGPAGSASAVVVRSSGKQAVQLADGGALTDPDNADLVDARRVRFLGATGAVLAECDVTVPPADPLTQLTGMSPES